MKKIGNLRVLVKPIEKEEKEEKIGSIIIPTTLRHKKKLTEAVVLKCGSGTPDIPMEVKEGDHIMFHMLENHYTTHEGVLIEMNEILYVLPAEHINVSVTEVPDFSVLSITNMEDV